MQYLDASEYVSFGLDAETSDALVTAASALIDSFCCCASLGVTQYVERFRPRQAGTVSLSYGPLSSLVSMRMRYRRPCMDTASPLAWAGQVFFNTEQWINVDESTIDIAADGMLTLPCNLLGLVPAEVEVTYAAGFTDVPDAVKVACAQIVRNAQSTPALNVSSQELDGMRMQYFSATLLDADLQRMLQPFVAQRMG